MSDSIVPSFPLMLLNAGPLTWTPYHQWNDRCLLSYRASRAACGGSLYYIPAYRKPRDQRNAPVRVHADAKGRWLLADDAAEPLLFAELHRYNYGYQSDLLIIYQPAHPLSEPGPKLEPVLERELWQDALALVISGALLSSGSDVMRVVVGEGVPPLPEEWGKAVTLHYLSRRVREATTAAPVHLVAQPVLEVIPAAWWAQEPGKGLSTQLGYIASRREALEGAARLKRKKPTPVRRKGLLRRLLFPKK